MEPYWKVIEQIVKESDVVLEILDARLVEYSRNQKLEELLKRIGRPVILVVNKIDLVPRKNLEISIDKINQVEKKEVVFVSARNPETIENLVQRIKKVFEIYGKRKALAPSKKKTQHREARADIVVGVVGYPNVGKSSIINALCHKTKAKVTSTPGTTHGGHWISATKEIKLIDTPGVIPLNHMDRTRLDLIGARSVEKIEDKEIVAARIIDMFLVNNKEKFENYYRIKIEEGEDAYQIIEKLGKSRMHLKKGGVVDINRTSTMIIDDWQKGKLTLR